MTRVAVVDIGTNSTRLLVCDVEDGRVVAEVDRRTTVTRLGQGVDATGALAEEAMGRVFVTLDAYEPAIAGAEVSTAVLTSAVRDASNGAAFAAQVRDRWGLDARTLPGEVEARLSFRGATSERDPDDPTPTVVVDIGGGSTELIIGAGGTVQAFVSLQAGVVRFTERHLHSDPPEPEDLQALAADARAVLGTGRPGDAQAAIAVAGTATQLAAIDLELEPDDSARVHGHRLALGRIEELLARLAQLTLAERREVTGLDPARAPTIVAGAILLAEVLRAFGLEEAEISEHDILRGAALEAVAPTGGG